MGKAKADPESILQFKKQVEDYQKEQEAILKKLKQQYQAVGSTWQDMQYQKFGQALLELEKEIKKQKPAFTRYAGKLKKKAGQLKDYLNQ